MSDSVVILRCRVPDDCCGVGLVVRAVVEGMTFLCFQALFTVTESLSVSVRLSCKPLSTC